MGELLLAAYVENAGRPNEHTRVTITCPQGCALGSVPLETLLRRHERGGGVSWDTCMTHK